MPKTQGKNKKIETIRHSLAHILAMAVKEFCPEVKFGIGPAVENGFYYDFDNLKIDERDLPNIEKRMKDLVKKDLTFVKKEITKTQAQKLFKYQPYKLEIIKQVLDKTVSVYQSGKFIDLCQGPHIQSAKEIDPESFKLTRVAGAYWKGDEKNPMLVRIYGVAFEKEEGLKKYLDQQAQAQKQDHRVLGQRLGMFLFDEEVGAGLPLWTSKGTILRRLIENYLYEELTTQGYQWLTTPHIGKLTLWQRSGHWELYRENMYSPIDIDQEQYLLKPMNCPFHVKVYQTQIRSYKELPLKYAEFGTVYRYERSGTLHGLTRVRGFTQDDAHIWCTEEQLSQELIKLLKHGLNLLETFGFKEFNVYLATQPEKYAGTKTGWKKAVKCLRYVLETLKLKYEIDKGGGVFYGPKIDIKIKDSLGREWQCTTIQVDFNLPERFDIFYIDQRGKKQKPIMVHRALLGSLERFIGVLLEHYEGALPLWLSPEQCWIIPVGTAHKKYAKDTAQQLKEEGLRVQVKDENETVGKKIREGELQKVPYLLVVGKKEMKKKTVGVRERGKGDIGEMKLKKFMAKTKTGMKSKK